jgi:hypothetical protein
VALDSWRRVATSGWPTTVVALGIVLSALNAIAQVLDLPTWATVTANLVVVVVGAAARLFQEVLKPHAEGIARRERTLENDLAYVPLPRVRDVDPFDPLVGVFQSTIARRHRPGPDAPPYIPRAIDQRLRRALRERRLVLVAGPAKSGKSRTAFEAIAHVFPDRRLIVPLPPLQGGDTRLSRQPLIDLAELRPAVSVDPAGPVLWLDDVEKHVVAGHLTLGTFRGLNGQYPGLVTVCTLRYQELEKIGEPMRELLARETSERVDLERELQPSELEGALALYGEAAADPSFARGMGEYFAAADQLLQKYRTGRETEPVGAAIVASAVDWRRAGMTRPIALDELRELARAYVPALRSGLELTEDRFRNGVEWATAPVASSAALITGEGEADQRRFVAFDYLLEWTSSQGAVVDESTWSFVLDRASSEECYSVGLAAREAELNDVAIRAYDIAADLERPPGPVAALGKHMNARSTRSTQSSGPRSRPSISARC